MFAFKDQASRSASVFAMFILTGVRTIGASVASQQVSFVPVMSMGCISGEARSNDGALGRGTDRLSGGCTTKPAVGFICGFILSLSLRSMVASQARQPSRPPPPSLLVLQYCTQTVLCRIDSVSFTRSSALPLLLPLSFSLSLSLSLSFWHSDHI